MRPLLKNVGETLKGHGIHIYDTANKVDFCSKSA